MHAPLRALRGFVPPYRTLLVLLASTVTPWVLVFHTAGSTTVPLNVRVIVVALAAGAVAVTGWSRPRTRAVDTLFGAEAAARADDEAMQVSADAADAPAAANAAVSADGAFTTPWLVRLAALSVFGSEVVYLMPLGPGLETGHRVQWWDYLPAALAIVPGVAIILLLARARLAALTLAITGGVTAVAVDGLWVLIFLGMENWGGPPDGWQAEQRRITVMLCAVHLALTTVAFITRIVWKRETRLAGCAWPPPGATSLSALAGFSGIALRLALFGVSLALEIHKPR